MQLTSNKNKLPFLKWNIYIMVSVEKFIIKIDFKK